MIILFYSEECQICQKILNYIHTNNKTSYFRLIDIKKTQVDNIKVIPTLIDKNFKIPIEGVKVFEYIVNLKYFNYPTNNIDFWLNKEVPTPTIDQDAKAIERHNLAYANFNIPAEEKSTPNTFIIRNKKNISLLKRSLI
jgi:glutaredoxin-related protein